LERAHEQRKSLDLTSIKKRLENYEHMLQYYTLMKMNKMKDSKAKSKEWWEVAKAKIYQGIGEEYCSVES
jgi:hypothetical protein